MAYSSYPQYGGFNQNGSYAQQSYAMPMNAVPQYAVPQPQPQQMPMRTQWVDGESSAKAFQMPIGWPANEPIALWDMNDPVIYMKSFNSMGMPNPLRKIHYTVEPEENQHMLMSGSAAASSSAPAADYATKEDMARMEERIMAAMQQHSAASPSRGGQNPSQQSGNRNGGGRE